jgi:hypothetical protein
MDRSSPLDALVGIGLTSRECRMKHWVVTLVTIVLIAGAMASPAAAAIAEPPSFALTMAGLAMFLGLHVLDRLGAKTSGARDLARRS